MTIWSAAVMLFVILDPIGNTPTCLALLKKVPRHRWRRVILRENLIALAVLVVFLVGGRFLLEMLDIRGPELGLAGGVVVFLIALRMIFPPRHGLFGNEEPDGEPFIVPLAIPLLAGPSAIAVVMLLTDTSSPKSLPLVQALLAVLLAWSCCLAVLLAAAPIARLLGQRGLIATERLMGMILTIIAVHMILSALEQYLHIIKIPA